MTTNTATVIIRSARERTEALCRELVLAQEVPAEAVFVVREVPFSQSMRTSFRIGLEQGRPWTFCVDADLLLRPGAIAHMLELAEQQPPNACEIQGLVLDKFFGGPRPAGNHLYRTAHLEEVIARIPNEGTNIRPEGHTLRSMKKAGYPWVQVPYVVGLHDFEQSYQDIFRKCFVQAHKHLGLTPLFMTIWREGSADDTDYRVALAGFARGIEHYDDVHIDIRGEHFKMSLNEFGLSEKLPIDTRAWPSARIEAIIQNWQEPAVYRQWYPTRFDLDKPDKRINVRSSIQRLRKHLERHGLKKTMSRAAGWTFIMIGERLQRIADQA
ncbi:hypothetical protein [Ectothiorhodospira marina]|uniref:Glycosyl transferase family 2 n=1 Tax=Ectothiorhodospira marina TaxID=1396821 RepID=A0A1H7IGB9_9GAMM|nr:hypothetical protein [Ectothiorhodospira marina]SEK59675.1 hypothetical protein SAMN05444515_10389 [Ectothiorhodospira marina]